MDGRDTRTPFECGITEVNEYMSPREVEGLGDFVEAIKAFDLLSMENRFSLINRYWGDLSPKVVECVADAEGWFMFLKSMLDGDLDAQETRELAGRMLKEMGYYRLYPEKED